MEPKFNGLTLAQMSIVTSREKRDLPAALSRLLTAETIAL